MGLLGRREPKANVEGELDGAFWRVAQSLEQQVAGGGGAGVCVYYRGRKVVDLWAGERDERGRPWRRDTMAMSFSTSKGVLSTLAHILADRGELDYDARVADYWPEFANKGKHGIRVRDVMTHRSGMAALRPLIGDSSEILDWDGMVRSLEEAEPGAPTGGRSAYHAFTYGWLLGETLQRATGRKLTELLHEELTTPLELDGCYIGTPKRVQRRAAELSRLEIFESERLRHCLFSDASTEFIHRLGRGLRSPINWKLFRNALIPPGDPSVFWHPRILDVPIPAANGLFTARSLARIYAVIAEGGALDGTRLFSRNTVRKASRIQTRERDRVLPISMQWRLGYHGAFSSRGRIDGAFGHFGFGGSGAWADPKRRLSVAMINNRVGGSPFGDMRIARISAAVLDSLSEARAEARASAEAAPLEVVRA